MVDPVPEDDDEVAMDRSRVDPIDMFLLALWRSQVQCSFSARVFLGPWSGGYEWGSANKWQVAWIRADIDIGTKGCPALLFQLPYLAAQSRDFDV